MSLANRLKTGAPVGPRGPVCGVLKLSRSLDEREAAALLGLLEDREWTSGAIREALAEENLPVLGRSTIERHRKRACSCPNPDGSGGV